MRIRNAFRVLFSNINYLYKSTLYRLLCVAFTVLIAYLAVLPGLSPVLKSAELAALISNLREIFSGLLHGGIAEATNNLPSTFAAFTAMLKAHVSAIKWAAIGAVAFLYVCKVLLAAGDYAFGRIFNEHMSSYTHFSFLPTLVDSAGAAFSYGALIAAIELVAGAIILGVSVVLAVYLIEYISVLAILLGILALVFGFALLRAATSRIVPIMANENCSFFSAFKRMLPDGKSLMSLTGNYAFMLILLYYVNVSIALFTFFTGLIISLPFSALAITSLSLIDYYCFKGKRFYVDYDNIVSPGVNRADAELTKFM